MNRSPDIWHRCCAYGIRISITMFKIYIIIVINKRIALGCPIQIPSVPANTPMTTLFNVRTRITVGSCDNSTFFLRLQNLQYTLSQWRSVTFQIRHAIVMTSSALMTSLIIGSKLKIQLYTIKCLLLQLGLLSLHISVCICCPGASLSCFTTDCDRSSSFISASSWYYTRVTP